jgi:hypothetical protein
MIREKRATRGLRMTELVGEDAEKDKAFWEHNTWEEDDSGNESFSEEEVKPDVFDDDFNDTEDDESSSDEENERAASKRSVSCVDGIGFSLKSLYDRNHWQRTHIKNLSNARPSQRHHQVLIHFS